MIKKRLFIEDLVVAAKSLSQINDKSNDVSLSLLNVSELYNKTVTFVCFFVIIKSFMNVSQSAFMMANVILYSLYMCN